MLLKRLCAYPLLSLSAALLLASAAVPSHADDKAKTAPVPVRTVALAMADMTRPMNDTRNPEAVPPLVIQTILKDLKLKGVEIVEMPGAKIPTTTDKLPAASASGPRYLLGVALLRTRESQGSGINTRFGRIGGKSTELAVQAQLTDTQTGQTSLVEEKESSGGVRLDGYIGVRNGALSDLFQNARPDGVWASGDTSYASIGQTLKTPLGTLLRKATEKAIKKALGQTK
ncbi:MAG: hypothetical protein V4671_22105 [Armatimonadota bacterium]